MTFTKKFLISLCFLFPVLAGAQPDSTFIDNLLSESSATIQCLGQGQPCSGGYECCQGLYCNYLRQCDGSAACHPSGTSCTTSTDCCSQFCYYGSCR